MTAMALSTQRGLLASIASSPPPKSDQPFPSIAPSLPGPSETTAQNDIINTQPLPVTATAEISIPKSESDVVVVGQTFTPGTIAANSGSLVLTSLGPSPAPQPAQDTVGGVIYTANSKSNFAIGVQTYTSGATAILFGTLVTTPKSPTNASQPAQIIIAGITYIADSHSDFVIGTHTFTPGATVTINGTPILISFSLPTSSPSPSSATVLNLASSLPTLAPTAITSTQPDPKVFTFAGNTITVNSLSDLVIGSQTITPGGVGTVSGTPISLDVASEADVVVGISTQLLGSVILGVFNPAPSGAAGGRVNESSLFTGRAGRVRPCAEGSKTMKTLTVMGAGIAKPFSLSDTVLEEDWDPDDNGDGDTPSMDTRFAHQISDSGHGRLERRFLDCLAEFAANKKGGTAVACSATKEAENNVVIWIARNEGFSDVDKPVLDKLGKVLGSLSCNSIDQSEVLLWEETVLYHQKRIEHSYIPNLRASFKAYDAIRRRNDINSPENISVSDAPLSVLRTLLFDPNSNGTSTLEKHMRLVIASYNLRRTRNIEEILYSSTSATFRSKSLWLDICLLARLRVAFQNFKDIALTLPSFEQVTIILVLRTLAPASPSQRPLNLNQTFGILQLDLSPATIKAVLGQNGLSPRLKASSQKGRSKSRTYTPRYKC
ncbi:hypothetical protein MMC15_002071 [Xylographa vitiligo]|nr:hypothetical protein [Xylographa vitiligo]